ncbi:MAG: hypothetical protein J6J00_10955 [Treponema sp.]|nr:hypothetical protein [Treponema sp.]
MDDKEYYSLMNRSSSWALQQALKKKAKAAKKDSAAKTYVEQPSYTALEARQGRADAEMLMEKQ